MRLVAGVIGAVIGWFVGGGPAGAVKGFMIGYSIGSVLFPPPGPELQGPRLSDLRAQDSTYGLPIPMIFGSAVRLSAMIIWAPPLIETEHVEEQGGGKGGDGGATVTTYTYACHCACAICEGPIDSIRKIWADGKLIYDTTTANVSLGAGMRVYKGTEDQMPDSLIESYEGVGSTPAYRGMAYVVFENFQLANYGNRIPQFSFEAVKAPGSAYVPTKVAEWSGTWSSAIWSQFSAPCLDSSIITIMGWAYWSYTGTYAFQTILNGGNQTNLVGGGAQPYPGDWPCTGNSDTPGALTAATGNKLAWLDMDGNLYYSNIVVGGLLDFSYGSFIKKNGVVWFSSTYGAAPDSKSYIFRWNTLTGDVVTSAEYGNFTIVGVTENYLYVHDGFARKLYRYNPDTLEQISIHFNGVFMGGVTETGEAISDSEIYVTSHSGGIYKLNPETETMTFVVATNGLFNTWRFGSFKVVSGNNFLVSTANQGAPFQIHYLAVTDLGATPLSAVVTELCAKVGYTPGDIDVSALTDTVEGYAVARRTSVRACLEPLGAVYNFDATESDHVIKFVKHGGDSIRTLDEEDLAAYDSGDEVPAITVGERTNDLELPVRVDVAYMRREFDYQPSTQPARRESAPGDSVISLELPMVLSDTQARRVAQSMLLNTWACRQKVAWTTTRKHLDLEPCDVITLPIAEGSASVRILKKDESRNGLVKWEGVTYDPSTFTGFGTATYGGVNGQVNVGGAGIAFSKGLLLDLPALRDQDDNAGYYWAASGTGGTGWPGAVLMKSNDDGVSYYQIASMMREATMGQAATALGAGPSHVFDEKNTITVTVYRGTLASATRKDIFNGANAALVGDEIIQFRTATLTSKNTYILSGLMRGRKGTEWAMTTHVAGERFLLLRPQGMTRVLANQSELGMDRLFKTVSVGQRVEDAFSTDFTPEGKALKPYSPVQLGGGRNENGDVMMRWRRRTRLGQELVDGRDVPLSEASEAYDVEIYSSSSYTTVLRTFSGVSTASLTYTAADQTADFGYLPSKVYVKIYQLSATVGRGDALKGAI